MKKFVLFFLAFFFVLLLTDRGSAQSNDRTTRSGNTFMLSNPDLNIYNPDLKPYVSSGKKSSRINSRNILDVLFSEDFDNIPGPVSGGPGTYVFPSGWLLVNVDNLTPAGSVGYVNDAWERREDFGENPLDSCAFSTSWYAPVGTANDWMISPAITLSDSNILSWNAKAYDINYADGYEVRISTTTQTVAGCLANPALFSITAENSTWTNRSVNLASYSGQTVYIAWRNNSNDKFLLVIDDILVEASTSYDAAIIKNLHPFDYSQLAVIQNYPLKLSAAVINNGTMNLTNVTLKAVVYQSGIESATLTSIPLPTLAPGQSDTLLTIIPYIPSDTGHIKILYNVYMNETDEDSSNNYDSAFIYISPDEMARDKGTAFTNLGIGAGNGGEMGTTFDLTEPEFLKGVKFFMGLPIPGEPYVALIREFVNGKPGNLIAIADTFYAQDDSAQWIYADLQNGSVQLPADTFVIAIQEIDSTLTLGCVPDIFTAKANWVTWPTSPFGGWAPVEEFGASFMKAFMIRPVFESTVYELSIDGDLSESEYRTLGVKLNSNNGFGSDIDISELKFYPDTLNKILYLGIEGKLTTSNSDGIGLWLNFNEIAGVDTGTILGGIGSHYMGQISFGMFKADFEVDYMFALNTGGTNSSVYVDVVGLSGTRTPQFLGSSNQTGSIKSGPSESGLFSINSLKYAFNNSGTPGKGFEIAIPFDELGVTNALYLETFAFVVSSDAYFSNVTIPGNVTGSNLGYNQDFNHLSGGPWHTDSTYTSVEDEEDNINPDEYSLSQNYPNPFNPETVIKYSLAAPEKVIIKLYNILGREIRVLVNENRSAGSHEIKFNAEDLPSGVYIYKLQAGGYTSARKMVLIR